MKLLRKPSFHYILIAVALFMAFTPVFLAHNYIRQDDLMWEIWPGMKMSDFGYLYHNTIFELARPICMLSFYITDLISIDIYHAVYVRFTGVLLLCALGILLYRWQILYWRKSVLAAAFAICAFTLPPYQVFAATGNYSLILTALLMTFGAMFCWHHAWYQPTHKRAWYIAGCILFFSSLLDYPLSSMYVWAFLLISYLNTLFSLQLREERAFMLRVAFTTVFLMGFYYVCSRIFMHMHHIDPSSGRVTAVNTDHLFSRLAGIVEVAGWHGDLWWWNTTISITQSRFMWIYGLFTIALVRLNWCHGIQNYRALILNVLQAIIVSFTLFFLAYLPVMASPERIITFRYALVTMPMLLYLAFWSMQILVDFFPFRFSPFKPLVKYSFFFFLGAITLYAMSFANLMLADGIVGPHETDFAYIQQQLTDKVIPLLKQNRQVVIHGIACDEAPKPIGPNLPGFIEYGMRTCQYQQQVIGVIIHSLTKMGYRSNYAKHNEVLYHDKEIVVNNTPWGTLVVNSASNANNDLTPYTDHGRRSVITIDTRETPSYQHYGFYKTLWERWHA